MTDAINVTIGSTAVTVTVSAGVSNTFVNEGSKFYFDGNEGNSYIWINPSNGRLEVVHEGTTHEGWGS